MVNNGQEGSPGWRVSLYLAVRAIRRGNRSTLALTILIIALVMVLMNFLGMIIAGVVTLYNDQMIDYQYGHVTIEPRDKETSIKNAGSLVERLRRVPGVTGVAAHASTGTTIGLTQAHRGSPRRCEPLTSRHEA